MTEIYLDGDMLDFEDTEKNATVADLVAIIEQELSRCRRFINEICVDGEGIEDWRRTETLGSPLSAHREVRLRTESAEALALEGLDMVQEYVKTIKDNITTCVRDMRVGERTADAEFTIVFEGLIEAVRLIDTLNKSASRYGMDLFRENPANFYKPLLECLECLRDARWAGDGVLVADILEYELAPYLEKMEKGVFHPSGL